MFYIIFSWIFLEFGNWDTSQNAKRASRTDRKLCVSIQRSCDLLQNSQSLSRWGSRFCDVICAQCYSSKPFRISIFLFLSYSFGIETINTFIHSRSSLENHTLFQTKMGKVYTRFQTKTAQKPYPMGRTYLYGLYERLPLGVLANRISVIMIVAFT